MRKRVAAVSLVGAAALLATTVVGAEAAQDRRGDRAKNVIYLLGDGMGRTHVTAARERYYGAAGSLNMERLPVVGQVRTYAVQKNSGQPGEADFAPEYVTDSASSATAWASGVKTYNAALGVDPKGRVVPTVMELAKEAGFRTGNVSTAEVTDATPASQMVHVLARGCQGPSYSAGSCQDTALTGTPLPTTDIRVTPAADQIASNGTADVILGGGLARFDASDEDALRRQGYTVLGSPEAQTVATRAELEAARGRKVFGLFNRGNLTIEKFKAENPLTPQAAEPTLSELTRKAISLLDRPNRRGKGFYLQVEGALIDKRSHANDAAQTLAEVKAFDDAVAEAMTFAQQDKNTLVIVTADHETAGFGIVEQGTSTNGEAVAPPTNVDSGNPSNSSTPARTAQKKDATRSTGPINGSGSSDPRNFAPATFRTADDPLSVQDGSLEANLWLAYLSGNHTGEDVPVFAYGPRSRQLGDTIENTQLFDVVTGALRLDR